MKLEISVAVVVATTNLVACSAPAPALDGDESAAAQSTAVRERYVCRDLDRGTRKLGQKTLVLTQTEDGSVGSTPVEFALERFEGAQVHSEEEAVGTVTKGGLGLVFESSDRAIKVTFNGPQTDFVCQRDEVDARTAMKRSFICSDYENATGHLKDRTVVLRKARFTELTEGVRHAYTLQLFSGANPTPTKTLNGKVTVQDVGFDFVPSGPQSSERDVKFFVYLDELNQSSMSTAGRPDGSFICR